ncbi:MAG: ferredoxin [Pseudomonadota bacterium]
MVNRTQTNLDDVEREAAASHLSVFGLVNDDTPDGVETIVLLGPREPGFWAFFSCSVEYKDGRADPLDRWSSRVVGNLAQRLGAKPFFPFGGPPYQPFTTWARASKRAFISPVGLLVHDQAGLMISYRGALGFSHTIESTDFFGENPCDTCGDQPCVSACPVSALAAESYDVSSCKSSLEEPQSDCLSMGCNVRRMCPVSQSYGRQPEQSAFHMRAFK